MIMGLNILQLSDIHLCGKNSPSAESILLGDTFPKGAPDAILVTGDIFDYSAFSNESKPDYTITKIDQNIKKAISFFNDLIRGINEFYKSSLNKESILFISGNHEITREGNDLNEHFANYKHFLDAFYDNSIPNWYLQDFTFVKEFNEQKVVIVGFRSPHCADGQHQQGAYDDYGLIDVKQLFNIRKKLREIRNSNEYTLIAALHHQFVLMEERDKTYVEKNYLRNNEEFIRFLSEENFCVVLHGHKHVNSNRRINIEQNIAKPEKMISVLGCGSLSETDETNRFNYVTVFPYGYKFEIEYSTYIRQNAGYVQEGETIKLPVVGKKDEKLIIENIISEAPDLSRAYKELCSYDTVTPQEEIYRLIDSTLLSLSSIAKSINSLPDSIYFILTVTHYRYILREKKSEYLENKLKSFIFNKEAQYFPHSECFNNICGVTEIKDFFSVYQQSLNNLNGRQKKIIVLSSIMMLLAEFYIIIKYKSEEFYNSIVSKKIDFAYSGNNLPSELRGNTVEFIVDDERRSLEISVTCDTAEAIKICSLIIKEFEITLHNFERDFSDNGFRVYYVLPKLRHNDKQTNEIESRQFTAYIPKLLPLLAGWNIYSEPEVFAREVIQNSIDAINVRREHDSNFVEDGSIDIIIDFDKQVGLSYFNIEDNGSGMTKYILERYLTTLGLSFYSGEDYNVLNLKYSPISQFGIGFLSCFMLGKHIEVKTKHYTTSVGYFLDIPNYDGCFFIEKDKTRTEVGTSIKIWENPEQKGTKYSFDREKIVSYINKYILCVDIDIYINNQLAIPRNYLQKKMQSETSLFSIKHFVPIRKDPCTGIWSASKNCEGVACTDFGITFYKPDKDVYSTSVENVLLNNGVLIPFLAKNQDHLLHLGDGYFCVAANFPPETINLDVSRDNLKNFIDNIDWKSITSAFKNLRANIDNKSIPYYLLQELYNPKKFRDYYLAFDFDRNNCEIIISYRKDTFKGNAASILDFLNYISDNQYTQNAVFPFPLNICKKEYGEFATLFLADLFMTVCSISSDLSVKHYSVDAHKREYDSPILDVLFAENKPFYKKNISIANEMYKVTQTSGSKNKYFNNEIKAIININKSYYNNIHNTMRSDITNMFKDRRYSAIEISKTSSRDSIQKIMNDPNAIPEQLFSLFKSYLKRSYTSVSKSNKLTLVDVAAITASAIYTLLNIASVVCSYKMLDKGVRIAVDRSKIEPANSWFHNIE